MLCTSFVALNIRANCCSRPSGTPASPWATASIDFGRDRGSDRASGTTMPSGRSMATTFHVALEAQRIGKPPRLSGVQDPAAVAGRPVIGVGVLIAAHVAHEHVEQRAVADPAVDLPGGHPDVDGLPFTPRLEGQTDVLTSVWV